MWNGIRECDIKTNVEYTTTFLTELPDKSKKESIITKLLNISIIRPIYKCGIKSAYENQRTISILPIIEKGFRRIYFKKAK